MPTAAQWLESRAGGESLPWPAIVDLIRIAQEELDVEADGKPGAGTLRALSERVGEKYGPTAPIPGNRAGVKRVYGDPSWVKLPRGRAVDLDDEWERKNIRWFTLHTGKRVRMHRLAGPDFVRLFKSACNASGYTPKSVQTYNPRVIGGTKRLSMHAYGIAFDVDPQQNPWGGVQKNGEESLLRQNMAFVDVFEKAGWTWGGRWRKGKGDDMHFQRAGT
tara:strand:+ start:829 stop:1485 length:657 start_codon:yes stop_codon:yes gene_type:complete